MRTLTPTLAAAQVRPGGVASLLARIEDRELRWVALLDTDSSTHPSNACTAAGAIVRGRIGAGGALAVQRITAPDEPTQWQCWSALGQVAAAGSDLALSALAGDPSRVRLFYTRTSGGAYALACLQSADGGRTWSAPADVVPDLPAVAGLAAANGQLLYHDPSDGYLRLVVRQGWDGGDWTAYPWAAGGALAARRGLAACWVGGVYYVASCDEEGPGLCRLRTGTCAPEGAGWSDPVAVIPPGMPAGSLAPRFPSLIYADGLWHLAYLETLAGALLEEKPIVLHSGDWDHWSFGCWVPLQGFGPLQRAALLGYGGAYYLAMEDAVFRAVPYSAGDAGRNLATSELLSYSVEEGAWYGRARVTLHSPGGRYAPGGATATAIRPLARLVLERGYRTAAGEERVARTPYYIMGAGVRCGGGPVQVLLDCEDGWGLLRRWRPDALYVWEGKTLAWLVAEVVCRASGLACRFDGAGAWSTVLASFAIAPGDWSDMAQGRPREALHTTGLGAVRTLLAKAAGRARWEADGALYCFVPSLQAYTGPHIVGAAGEILDAYYGQGLVEPTEARVFGDGVAGSAAAQDPARTSRRYLATYADPHLTGAMPCALRAAGLVYDGRARGLAGWVEVPCRLDLDLYDQLAVEEAPAPGLAGELLRAVGIVERYDRSSGAFTTRIAYERA